MEDKEIILNQESFILTSKVECTIIHKSIPLRLRASFGTSHSSTIIRYNSFIQIIIKNENLDDKNNLIYGIGESGLPPKKPGCYLADSNDICSYINNYFNFLKSILNNLQSYKALLEEYILNFKNILNPKAILPEFIFILFYSMDNCPANKYEYSNAAKNCIEGALFDICGKISNLTVMDLLKIPQRENISTFYTVSIGPDNEMIQCLNLGLKYTNYIKIKLNHDIEKSKHTLNLLDDKCKEYESTKKHKCIWSIDLNSDFNDPKQCEKLINEVILNYKERIYMIEQPFPIKYNDIQKNIEGWKHIKNLCENNNILIYADESSSTIDTIENLKDIVSGINIKLEKCGGIRNGLKCIEKGKELNLKIWIGCMVGSSILMNMASVLTPLSTYSDLDGFLLVEEDSQPGKGGFQWDGEKGIIKLSKDKGLGVTLKN